MRKTILLFVLALAQYIGVSAAYVGVVPQVGVYYFVKMAPRTTAEKVWLTADVANSVGMQSNYDGSDTQLWRFVASGTGWQLQNKATGLYIDADLTDKGYTNTDNAMSRIKLVAPVPTVALKIGKQKYTGGWSIAPAAWDGVTGDTATCVVDVDTPFDANGVLVNMARDVCKFYFYSSGNGPTCRTSGLLDNGVFCFYTQNGVAKPLMRFLLARADALATSTSVGPNPGQASQDDYDSFQTALGEAHAVFNDPSTTDVQIMQAYQELTNVYNGFLSSTGPQLSGNVNETWYFVQGTRPANTYLTDDGTKLMCKPIDQTDNQLWKLVDNGSGGFVMKNKATGKYVDSDATRTIYDSGLIIATKTDIPTVGLKANVSSVVTNNIHRFWIENAGSVLTFRLHAGSEVGSTGTGDVMNWTGDANDNSTWLFFDYASIQRELLGQELSTASNSLNVVSVGVSPGQVTQPVHDALQTVYANALAVYNDPSSTDADYIAAKQSLSDANAVLLAAVNLPAISAADPAVWYTFRVPAGRPDANNTYVLASSGAGQNLKYEVASSPVPDSQLWKLVSNGAGFALVNRETGEYIDADLSTGTTLKSRPDVPTGTLKFRMSTTIVNGAYTFWFENSDGSTPEFRMHAGGTEPMNWTGGVNDHCEWMLTTVQPPTMAETLAAKLAAALALYNNTVEGNEYTQYPAADRTTFINFITAMQAVNQTGKTDAEINAEIDALKVATQTYNAAQVKTLDAAPYKWYTVESVVYPGKFLTVDPATLSLTCQALNATAPSTQLFRFESKPALGTFTSLYNIINEGAPTGTVRCEGSAWDVVYNTGTNFSTGGTYDFVTMGYFPWNITIENGASGSQSLVISTTGDSMDTNGSAMVNGGTGVYNGKAAWLIKFVKQDPNGIDSPSSKIIISTKDRKIKVIGTNSPVSVYTLAGVSVDLRKELNAGVYIVKVEDKVAKVVIK